MTSAVRDLHSSGRVKLTDNLYLCISAASYPPRGDAPDAGSLITNVVLSTRLREVAARDLGPLRNPLFT